MGFAVRDRPAKVYSGGMRRRLDLASSLMGYPAVVFLDEPTTGLDPESRLGMWDVVRTVPRNVSKRFMESSPCGGDLDS